MLTLRCIPDVHCPKCGSKIFRDMVEQCTHADHEGNAVYDMFAGIWCRNESCEHHKNAIDEDDIVF